jgi:hypothetical protein
LWNRPESLFIKSNRLSGLFRNKIQSLWNRPESLFIKSNRLCDLFHLFQTAKLTIWAFGINSLAFSLNCRVIDKWLVGNYSDMAYLDFTIRAIGITANQLKSGVSLENIV